MISGPVWVVKRVADYKQSGLSTRKFIPCIVSLLKTGHPEATQIKVADSQAKTVLITGCSSGIGACLARALHEREGYRVFATTRRAEDAESLRRAGLDALPLDLADPASINSAVDRVLERGDGGIEVLINNGAYGQPGAVEDLSRDVLRRQLEVNLLGTHELTTRVLKVMRGQGERGRGRIVQISSILGLVSLPFRGAYNASKYALEALTDALRLELRDTDIHLSLIEPGPIASRFRENAMRRFEAHIDTAGSPHRDRYEAVRARLHSDKPDPFTLPPEAVLEKTLLAMERRRPRPRYPVTFPARALARLKRVLPDRLMDAMVAKLSR